MTPAPAASRLALFFAAALSLMAALPAGAAMTLEDARFYAADAFYSGDYAKAARAFSEVLEQDPDDLYARSRLCACLALGGTSLDRAALECRIVLEAAPDHLFAQTFLGATLLLQGDPDGGQAALDQVLALAPDYPPGLFLAGLSRLLAGQGKAALEFFSRLSRADHPEAAVHAALADVYYRLGLYAAAKLEMERGLALRPSDAWYLTRLGRILAASGQNGLAVTAFEQILAMDKTNAPARTYLGAALSGQAFAASANGQPEEALKLCRQALGIDPTQAGCLFLARAAGKLPQAGSAQPGLP